MQIGSLSLLLTYRLFNHAWATLGHPWSPSGWQHYYKLLVQICKSINEQPINVTAAAHDTHWWHIKEQAWIAGEVHDKWNVVNINFSAKFVFFKLFDATKRGWSIMIDSWTPCMLAFEQAVVRGEIPRYLGFTAWWLLFNTTTSPVQDGITHIRNFFGLIFAPFRESGEASFIFI